MKKIFNKIIFVEPFFISYQQTVDLECRNFAEHIRRLAVTFRQQYVLKPLLVKNLKKLISLHDLTVCRGFNKGKYLLYVVLLF